jgi:hypothetical protein
MLLGGFLLLVALSGALAGGWTASVFGLQGKYEVPVAEVSVPGAALYVNLFNIDPAPYLPDGLLDTYVVATSPTGEDLFLGVGAANEVQEFLFGVPYDAASELAGGAFVVRSVPGTVLPAPNPQEATIWRGSAAGDPAPLRWSNEFGSEVFIVMNSDGTAGVAADLTATLESPRLLAMVTILMVGSLLFGLLGALVLARAVRSAR